VAEYTVVFARSARKELQSLDPPVALRILKSIEALVSGPRHIPVLKLASHLGDFRHGQTTSSAPLRTQLRERIIDRIAELKLRDFEAAEQLGLSPGQMSRLKAKDDIFTLDRLIDAAANIGITVRMSATRPYGRG
jgi:predicted XRE-type DNA-binding protein